MTPPTGTIGNPVIDGARCGTVLGASRPGGGSRRRRSPSRGRPAWGHSEWRLQGPLAPRWSRPVRQVRCPDREDGAGAAWIRRASSARPSALAAALSTQAPMPHPGTAPARRPQDCKPPRAFSPSDSSHIPGHRPLARPGSTERPGRELSLAPACDLTVGSPLAATPVSAACTPWGGSASQCCPRCRSR